MAMARRRMGHADLTIHGFRSTFRDWAAETTNYPRAVADPRRGHFFFLDPTSRAPVHERLPEVVR